MEKSILLWYRKPWSIHLVEPDDSKPYIKVVGEGANTFLICYPVRYKDGTVVWDNPPPKDIRLRTASIMNADKYPVPTDRMIREYYNLSLIDLTLKWYDSIK